MRLDGHEKQGSVPSFAMSHLVSERITDFPALQAIREDWQTLTARLPENTDFFATWDYTWVYLNFHRPANWHVVTFREPDGGTLVAVFGLQVFQISHEGHVFWASQPLGVGYLPYIEFPIESRVQRDVLQHLLNTVLQQELGIELALFWPLHQGSPLYLTLVEDFGRTDLLKTLRFPGNLHEIETRGREFTSYRQTCSSKSFKYAEYVQRKLGREGSLRFTLNEPNACLPPLVETLCLQNMQKFGERHVGRNLPRWSAFIADIASLLSALGIAQLSTLRLDERVVASVLSFMHKRRRYLYLIDHDPEFVRFSPSKILLANLLKHTFNEGGVFCFGAGGYDYKRDWGPAVGELKAAIVYLNPAARTVLDEHLNFNGLKALAAV